MNIRKARAEDAAIVASAEREIAKTPGRLVSRPEELEEENFRQTITALADGRGGLYLVAEEEGVMIGHAFLQRLPLAAITHVVVLTIAVHEGYQRRGVGKALLNRLLEWAIEEPTVEKVELQVRSSNPNAIALYRSLGFIEEGRKTKRVKLPSGDYADDIYMARWVG